MSSLLKDLREEVEWQSGPPPRVISKVFALWKQKEASEGRKIPLTEITRKVGLAKMTVRRFTEPGGDVSGSPLSSASAFARYFRVPISMVIEMEKR